MVFNRGNGIYRSVFVAVVGLVVVSTSLGMGAYFGSLYSPDKKQYQAVRSGSPTDKGYNGPSESLRDIAGVDSRVERMIANPHPNTGKDHEKRDLAAQEAMAVWAMWMVGISGLTLVISSFGLIALFKTIRQGREALEKANEANEIAREAHEIQNRPWLAIETSENRGMKIVNGRPRLTFKIKISNKGCSPATDVSYFVDFCIGYEPHIQMLANYSMRRKEILGCDEDIFHGAYVEKPSSIEHSGDIIDRADCYVVICVFYRSVFSDALKTTAAFFKMLDGKSDDGMIDLTTPLNSSSIFLVPWSEMAGVIE